MLTKNLKIGQHGLITVGDFKDTIIYRKYDGEFYRSIDCTHFSNINKEDEVRKLENVKITYDGCEETKSDFPKMMWVSDYYDFYLTQKWVVHGKFNDQYIVDSDVKFGTFMTFKYAKDIEPEKIEFTLEEISYKLGLTGNQKLVIK